jgi:hypothetical protein
MASGGACGRLLGGLFFCLPLAGCGYAVLPGSAGNCGHTDTETRADVLAFAKDVLLGYEPRTGKRLYNSTGRVKRWPTGAVVTWDVVEAPDGQADQLAVEVAAVFAEVAEVVGDAVRFEQRAHADIRLYFAAYGNWEAVTPFSPTSRNVALTQPYNDGDLRLTQGDIVVDPIGSFSRVRGAIRHEVLHALGLAGHSDHLSTCSFMVSDTSACYLRSELPTDEMAPIDKCLARFVYQSLQPGDTEADIELAFAESWDSVCELEFADAGVTPNGP